MSEENHPIPLEDLLAHAAWVTGLARSLLFDQGRVDDVVQQTWMVAMERQPRERSQLRAWLGGIVRNVARNEQRGERRRSAREERAASPEGLPSTVDVVARAELQRRVVDAVMALDEPYRSTVLLRWFDGLSAAEIARQQGVPDGTVRARCTRALERLREQLDGASGGERRAWSLALLPLAVGPGSVVPVAATSLTLTGTGTLTGVVLMGSKLKLVLGVVALLFVTGGAWWLLDEEVDVSPPRAPGVVADSPEAEVVTSPVVVPPVEPLIPEPALQGTPQPLLAATSGGAGEPAPSVAALFTIVGRVVSPDGRAVVGARVAHRPRWELVPTKTMEMHLANAAPPRPPLTWVTTDAHGAFEIEATPLPVADGAKPVGYDTLFVRDEDFELTGRIVPLPEGRARHDVGDLVLQPAGVVTGRVVDEAGLPLEGVRLESARNNKFGPFERWEELGSVKPYWTVTTGADGRFLLGSLWPMRQGFDVVKDGYSSEHLNLEPVVGDGEDLGDIVLLGDRFLAGVVVDADGEALEGIDVVGRPSKYMKFGSFQGEDSAQNQLNVRIHSPGAEVRAVTDASGGFRLEGLAAGTYAVAAGGAGWEAESVREVPENTDDLVIALRPLATLFVRVLDEAGGRVDGATGSAWRISGAESGHFEAWLLVMDGEEAASAAAASGIEEPEGLLIVRGAGRLGTRLEVSAPGFAPRRVELPGVVAPDSVETEVRLTTGAQLSGRVTDPAGKPVEAATVIVQLLSGTKGAPAGSLTADGATLELRESVTDEAGAYRVDTLQAGDWRISVNAAGRGAVAARDVTLAAGQRLVGQDVQLEAAAVLRGVVLQADGTPWRGTVTLRGDALGQRSERPLGADPLYRSTPSMGHDQVQSDADGTFVFDDLPAGDFELRTYQSEPVAVSLKAGEERDIEIVFPQPVLISGQVTDTDGAVIGAEVRVHFGRGTDLQRASFLLMEIRTDAQGWYRAAPTSPGDYTLVVEHDGAWTEAVELTVDHGSNARADFRFGDLELLGVVRDAESGLPVAGATVEVVNQRLDQAHAIGKPRAGTNDRLFVLRVTTDEAGRFALERLSPGPHELSVTAEGYAPLVADPVDVQADSQPAPLEIQLTR